MENPTTTTSLTLDQTDAEAIAMIQRHLASDTAMFRGNVPKRAAISWAVRKVAEELKSAGDR